METPVSIKLHSSSNPTPGWNEQVPLVALSNGEIAVCGFSPTAIYTLTDLQEIIENMQEALPQLANQLTTQQQVSSRQQYTGSRQQVQGGQFAGNLRGFLRQQQGQQQGGGV